MHSAKVFSESLDKYAEVMHWTRNFFPVPLGKVGEDFVSELSRLFQAFGIASTLESIVLKAATVLPMLLLQKPYRGHLNESLMEGRAIQHRLPKRSSPKTKNNFARSFPNLMFAGKCKAALYCQAWRKWMIP